MDRIEVWKVGELWEASLPRGNLARRKSTAKEAVRSSALACLTHYGEAHLSQAARDALAWPPIRWESRYAPDPRSGLAMPVQRSAQKAGRS